MIDIWNYRDFIEITESSGIVDFSNGLGDMYRIKRDDLKHYKKYDEDERTPCIDRRPESICDYYLHEPDISQTPIADFEHANLNEAPFSRSIFNIPLGAFIKKLRG